MVCRIHSGDARLQACQTSFVSDCVVCLNAGTWGTWWTSLNHLLEMVPMLVPFRTMDDSGLCSVVHSVAIYLSAALRDLLHRARGSGGYEDRDWGTFQIELAAEELFFSRPLCRTSLQFSSALVEFQRLRRAASAC